MNFSVCWQFWCFSSETLHLGQLRALFTQKCIYFCLIKARNPSFFHRCRVIVPWGSHLTPSLDEFQTAACLWFLIVLLFSVKWRRLRGKWSVLEVGQWGLCWVPSGVCFHPSNFLFWEAIWQWSFWRRVKSFFWKVWCCLWEKQTQFFCFILFGWQVLLSL